MSQIDQQSAFEDTMQLGIEAHARGDHVEALKCRADAFFLAENSVDAARALRDGAASHGYLGELEQAYVGAATSVDLLADANNPRELGASYDRLGRICVLQNMQRERAGMHTYNPGQASFNHAKDLLETQDQYYINMISRAAVSSALYGNRKSAIIDAGRAVASAIKSETKKKHFAVALSAVGLSVLLRLPVAKRSNGVLFRVAEKVMR